MATHSNGNGNGNGLWKTIGTMGLTALGVMVLFYFGVVQGRIESNSQAINENRKAIAQIREDISGLAAEIRSDLEGSHARWEDWSARWNRDIEKNERRYQELELKIDDLRALIIEIHKERR